MTAREAIEIASKNAKLQAILIQGLHVVASRKAVEKAEARGVKFSYLHLWNDGKCVAVPNYNTRGE